MRESTFPEEVNFPGKSEDEKKKICSTRPYGCAEGKKINKVSLRRFHILRSPPILPGRRNKGKIQTEAL